MAKRSPVYKLKADLAAATGAALIGRSGVTVDAKLTSIDAAIAAEILARGGADTTLTAAVAAITASSLGLGTASNVQHASIGIGAPPDYPCDVRSGVVAAVIGADAGLTTRSNNNVKRGQIGAPHYSTSQAPIAMITGHSMNGANEIFIGAGWDVTAATCIKFCASTSAIDFNGGTVKLDITTAGLAISGGSSRLNHYEVGTWTPVLRDANSNLAGGSSAGGDFVRIGSQVWFSGRFVVNSVAALAPAESLFIDGLPFVASLAAAIYAPASVTATGLTITAGQSLAGEVGNGGNEMTLLKWSATTGNVNALKADITVGSDLRFSGTYKC